MTRTSGESCALAWEDRSGRPPPAWFQPAARIPPYMGPRSSVRRPATPRMPGPVWVPITGPISRDQLGVAPVDLAAALGEALGLGLRLDVLDRERVTAVLPARLEVGDEPLERAARGPHPLDRLHLAVDREDRLDLQRRADPRRRRADPPAAAQVLERVHHDPDLQVVAQRLRGGERTRQVRAALDRVGRGDGHEAVAGASRCASRRRPCGAASIPCSISSWRACSAVLHRARDRAREVDADDARGPARRSGS